MMPKIRRLFLLLGCLAFSVPVGFFVLSAAALSTTPIPANPEPTQVQPEGILIKPPPGIDAAAVAQPVHPVQDPQAGVLIKRGEYLTVAGDCQSCHSISGGSPFAGGQPVQTPFGPLFSTNITPDKTYGIGRWTDAQFWNALHNGIGPGNSLLVFPRYLYPLMPWQDFNKLSYPDVMSIKAYLDSLQPVASKNRPSQMSFPFTIRAGLLGWRLLFFRDHPIKYDPSWSPQVRDGAFLVQALAHCSECHTQRNLLMATEPSRYLAGGHILAQSWYAPNITRSNPDGIGGWSSNDLFQYLYRGGAVGPGAPYGPMKSVVDDSLSRLPPAAVHNIVSYLQSGTPDTKSQIPRRSLMPPAAAGAQVYADNCARCHGANGEGVNNNFPNLAGNESVWDGSPENIVSMILGGFQPWHKDQSAMPEFNQVLTDDQIATVANYVRTSWGNQGAADADGASVAAERRLASDWVSLNTGTTQARLQDGAAAQNFDDISGKLELFGDRQNCMLNAQFSNSDPSAAHKLVYLVGACSKAGSAFRGKIVIDGTTYPVALNLQQAISGNQVSEVLLSGGVAGSGQQFSARIALVKPTD